MVHWLSAINFILLSRAGALLSGINDQEQRESVVQTGETGFVALCRLICVIPREVAAIHAAVDEDAPYGLLRLRFVPRRMTGA
jgi:hypothetical protein